MHSIFHKRCNREQGDGAEWDLNCFQSFALALEITADGRMGYVTMHDTNDTDETGHRRE